MSINFCVINYDKNKELDWSIFFVYQHYDLFLSKLMHFRALCYFNADRELGDMAVKKLYEKTRKEATAKQNHQWK